MFSMFIIQSCLVCLLFSKQNGLLAKRGRCNVSTEQEPMYECMYKGNTLGGVPEICEGRIKTAKRVTSVSRLSTY